MTLISSHPLRILQLNTADIQGGAAKVARTLHSLYLDSGHDAYMAVGVAQQPNERIRTLDNRRKNNPTWLARGVLQRTLGWQDISYPGSHRLPTLFPEGWDILHAHNLHCFYFDLSALPALARRAPVVLTMHDMWAITGHCAYALECTRWRTGCGHCPDLERYQPIRTDGTRFNWQRKKRLFAASDLWITAPAQWLLDLLDDSLLAGRPQKLIPNGINTQLFHPASRQEARRQLGLPQEGSILLFVADPTSVYKDFGTLRQAVDQLFQTLPARQRPTLLVLGADRENRAVDWETVGEHIRAFPFTPDENRVALYYQAADVLAHAARAEVLPLSILEAMACGCAVVASDVGGIGEEVVHGETGLLVPSGNVEAMAAALHALLTDPDRAAQMGLAGRARVEAHFDRRNMAAAYLRFYDEVLETAQSRKERAQHA